MIITPSQQRKCPPRRSASRLLCSAGPLAVACLLYTSAWGASTIYVAQSSGNDQNNGGMPAAAVKSVARGLALAAAGTEVQIAAGSYDEQLPPIPQGVTLSGGWDPSFDPNKRTLLTAQGLRTLKSGKDKCGHDGAGLTCLTNSKGDRVVTLLSPGGQALKQLVVLGPDLSSKNDGSSSFGVVVDGAAGVRLDYVSIEAGNGAVGVAGENKLPPTGTCVRGGVGGGGGYNTGQGTIWSSSCSAQPASAGDSVYVNQVMVAQGGPGGATGHTECSNPEAVSGDLGNGARGGNGQNGVQGAAGAAAPTDPGQFTYAQPGGDLVWIRNHGGRGGDGSNGAGGGGGAAGDNGQIIYWCLAAQPVTGGAGHNGGAGGCGGGAGAGGSSGGGAFALVVADTSVGSAGLVLLGGAGGQGGRGGSSAKGTSGVHDDSWGSTGESTGNVCGTGPARNAGTGGQGGYGGDGGGGGGGAGGNGGPSIQLVSLAEGALTMDANATLRYAGGRSGAGGTGGTGVQDNNAGPPGNGGASADHLSIPLLMHVSASASSSVPGNPPAYAVDGDPNTAWNSGGGPPAWIELDLTRTVTLSKVRLLVGQSPAGPTTHQLYFGPSPAPTAVIATLSGTTSDMQWLEADVSDAKPSGRYLRVQTTASPSWVAWREIVVVPQPEVQNIASGRRD